MSTGRPLGTTFLDSLLWQQTCSGRRRNLLEVGHDKT